MPDIYFTPKTLEVKPLSTTPDPLALLGSKALGEPPLMYGIGSYFASVDTDGNCALFLFEHNRCKCLEMVPSTRGNYK